MGLKSIVTEFRQHFNKKFAIISKRYEIGCQLVLITKRKSHVCFQLVPTSVTLDDLERRILRYFAEFDSFGGRLRHSG